MSVICFSSLKGGVGKTSLTINVAHAFAIQGSSTLIIDLDPSAHATRFFRKLGRRNMFPAHPPIARIFLSKEHDVEIPIVSDNENEAIVMRVRPNLELIPGGEELRYFIPGHGVRYFRKFKPLIEELKLHFDHILIDTQPEFNVLTRSAIECSNLVVLPVDASEMSIDGIEDLIERSGHLKASRWAVARTMVTSNAVRSHILSNDRLRERLTFRGNTNITKASLNSLAASVLHLPNSIEEHKYRIQEDLFMLDSLIFRTEVQNQLSFLGKTAFDNRKTHVLAEQYLSLARELETVISETDDDNDETIAYNIEEQQSVAC